MIHTNIICMSTFNKSNFIFKNKKNDSQHFVTKYIIKSFEKLTTQNSHLLIANNALTNWRKSINENMFHRIGKCFSSGKNKYILNHYQHHSVVYILTVPHLQDFPLNNVYICSWENIGKKTHLQFCSNILISWLK